VRVACPICGPIKRELNFGNIQMEVGVTPFKDFSNIQLKLPLDIGLEVDLLNKYQLSFNLSSSFQVSSKCKIKIWIFRFSRTTRQISPSGAHLESSILK
jgi:hypothetical protein